MPLLSANNAPSQIVSGPVVVTDRLEVREAQVHNVGVEEVSTHVSKEVALVQLRALIAAFQEVDDYDPALHHNTNQPVLWINDADYLKDVKALLHELRRLNDLLETNKKPDTASVEKSLVGQMAERVCLRAADVVGVGIGTVILASAYAALEHFDAGREVLQHIPLVSKAK